MILSSHGVEGGWKGTEAGYTVGSQEVIGSHPAIPGEAETASHGVSLDHTALKALLGPLFHSPHGGF